jgi:ectoine hydroxylase-related dioxygenase (phytanoyl-CoA dioxygenase family)
VQAVHRRKTRFAANVNRVAMALERRGIVATYELHDRVLSNPVSRRRLARRPPQLDAVQTRILDELRREGYSVAAFSELFPDPGDWAAVEAEARQFVEQTEAALAREAAGEVDGSLRRRSGKEFVVRMLSWGVEVGFDDAWFRLCASRRMLDLANAYLGMWSKLEYVDVWYSVPQPEGAERVASQRWHRDYDDQHLLKAFLYLVDVDEETGPFEYVPGSAPGGRYGDAWPWRPLGENYPSQDELAQRIPADAIRTFTAPKGTIILCNTSGFHRGGFTTAKPRVLATVTYSSPASLASLTERNFTLRGDTGSLDAETRYALT